MLEKSLSTSLWDPDDLFFLLNSVVYLYAYIMLTNYNFYKGFKLFKESSQTVAHRLFL